MFFIAIPDLNVSLRAPPPLSTLPLHSPSPPPHPPSVCDGRDKLILPELLINV